MGCASSNSTSSEVLLGYWNAQFRGNVMRFLLEYTGLKYAEKRYQFSNMDEWFKSDKPSLGLPFPNLPYIIDGNVKVTEALAVASYIAERGGKPELHGRNIDRVFVEQISSVANETLKQVYNYMTIPDKRDEFYEAITTKIDQILEFLGNKQWMVGYLTVADFFVYCLSKQAQAVLGDKFYSKYGNKFDSYQKRFESLPQIAQYMKSDQYISY